MPFVSYDTKMSQKQKYFHHGSPVIAPEGGWVPVYKNLSSPYFQYLVECLEDKRILPSPLPHSVYSVNPSLYNINPYKFPALFQAVIDHAVKSPQPPSMTLQSSDNGSIVHPSLRSVASQKDQSNSDLAPSIFQDSFQPEVE